MEFRDKVRGELRRSPAGLTWAELRKRARFARARACPEWTKQLEREIGLKRVEGEGRAKVWRLGVDTDSILKRARQFRKALNFTMTQEELDAAKWEGRA